MILLAPARFRLRLRFFFVAMACAVSIAVFAGFAPTFYLRGSFTQTRPMSVLLHVHGIVFSAWVAFFLVQTLLMARGARRLHRQLGWIGAGIATAMVILVTAAVIEELHRVGGFPPPPLALALALSAFDIIVFAILVGAALYYRNRPDWHKRFMLAATIILLGACKRLAADGRVTQTPSRVRGRCGSRDFSLLRIARRCGRAGARNIERGSAARMLGVNRAQAIGRSGALVGHGTRATRSGKTCRLSLLLKRRRGLGSRTQSHFRLGSLRLRSAIGSAIGRAAGAGRGV